MSLYEDLVLQAQRNFNTYYNLYRIGETAVKLSRKPPLDHDEQIKIFAKQVQDAEYIIIGGASGLSAAGGGDFYYGDTPSFRRYFGKFAKKYGFAGAFRGMQYPFATRGEFWAYLATFLHTTQTAPIRPPYLTLDDILQGKDFFIVTTNQDTQFTKLYPDEKVAAIQGDHRFFQCRSQCCDHTWDATEPVATMIRAIGDDTTVADELIPRCPYCGDEAFPWVRGYGNFLQGSKYDEQYQKISSAIEQNQKKKILFIELGVGRMTPMFIQEPFWSLTRNLADAYYIAINAQYDLLPEMIEDRGMTIHGDIAQVLTDVQTVLKA